MILKEFTVDNGSRLNKITRALSENYDYELDFNSMTPVRAKSMIDRAQSAITESNSTSHRVKLRLIAESLDLWMQANIQTELTAMVAEGLDDESVDGAKVIIAAQELTDKIQGMIEDVAKMQVQDLLPIADAMKSEIGAPEADAFASSADAALGGLVDSLKSAKTSMEDAIAAAQGNAPATDMDGFDADPDLDGFDADSNSDMDTDDEFGGDMDIDDEFGGDDATVGGAEPTGRELKDEE